MNQITTNRSDAENLRRSTSDPRIRQQVIAAKVAWKATNTISYIGVPLLKVAAEGEHARRRIEGAIEKQAVEPAEESVARRESE